MIPFGPVPSRRLGRSLGINTIPPKHCTYACTYCQVGRTPNMGLDRRSFHKPEVILAEVRDHLEKTHEPVDYLTIVPDGEPTLDSNLGSTIELLRTLKLPIAVITNASLIDRPEVQHDLGLADWVSVKVDAVDETIWHRINRPNRHLDLATILAGVNQFAATYKGQLVTETMLVDGVNDGIESIRNLAKFLGRLKPSRAYLSIPTRPPAEPGVRCPGEKVVNRAFQILSETLSCVEYLIGYEGNAFTSTGNLEKDLLSITAVHPLRADAVQEMLVQNHLGWDRVDALMQRQELAEVVYSGNKYYTRKWKRGP